MQIKKKISWCMAHKLPNHHELHGHGYELEIVLEGKIIQNPNSEDDGLIIDFKVIEQVARANVINLLDRACIISEKDTIAQSLHQIADQIKIVFVPFVPSSELIIQWLFEKLTQAFLDFPIPELHLKELTLWDSDSTAITYKKTNESDN